MGFSSEFFEEEVLLKGSSAYTIKRSTDCVGRPTEIQLPDASAIRYTYDGPFLKKEWAPPIFEWGDAIGTITTNTIHSAILKKRRSLDG